MTDDTTPDDDGPAIGCPHCGGPIRSLDMILTTCDVVQWTIEGGDLVPQYAESGSTVHWDSSQAFDQLRPYECADCSAMLSDADIAKQLPPELQAQLNPAPAADLAAAPPAG